jgi:hypothetical protein
MNDNDEATGLECVLAGKNSVFNVQKCALAGKIPTQWPNMCAGRY